MLELVKVNPFTHSCLFFLILNNRDCYLLNYSRQLLFDMEVTFLFMSINRFIDDAFYNKL